MKVVLRNLGALKYAEFSLGDLTIICGKNNTGKTYATYALYGFLYNWESEIEIKVPDRQIETLLHEGSVQIDITTYVNDAQKIISSGCESYSATLSRVFASSSKYFLNSSFEVKIDPAEIHIAPTFEKTMGAPKAKLFSISKDQDSATLTISLLVDKKEIRIPPIIIKNMISSALEEIVFNSVFCRPFIASAERTGAAIFRKELNFSRNRLLEEMNLNKEVNPIELMNKVYLDYALPVKQNVEFTRQLESISKQESFLYKEHPDILDSFSDIIGGKYIVTRNDELYYSPRGENVKLSMDESSSAVRSLLDIGFYLRHVAQRGDLLMVDEPELNLHPENQRRVARLFARLINVGIKVFITTHSDYIIRELNTLILLNSKAPRMKVIAEREGYHTSELLSYDAVKVYTAEVSSVRLEGKSRKVKCLTLVEATVTKEHGIEAKSFDETIETINKIQDEIVWGEEVLD